MGAAGGIGAAGGAAAEAEDDPKGSFSSKPPPDLSLPVPAFEDEPPPMELNMSSHSSLMGLLLESVTPLLPMLGFEKLEPKSPKSSKPLLLDAEAD